MYLFLFNHTYLLIWYRHSPITAGIVGKNEYKRVVKQVAQDMITRGKVRISFHNSGIVGWYLFPWRRLIQGENRHSQLQSKWLFQTTYVYPFIVLRVSTSFLSRSFRSRVTFQ